MLEESSSAAEEPTAFSGDVLDRAKLAKKLTDALPRLPSSCTIAIDAPWGDGKTWFGSNWARYLKEQDSERPVAWLDAFESDWSSDPFVAISAEILLATKAPAAARARFLDATKAVAKAALPMAGKAAVAYLSGLALSSDVLKPLADALKDPAESVGSAVEGLIEEQITNHEERQKTVHAFRQSLEALAAPGGRDRPMVFFIDELDRCRPDYAVGLIERIKHFFDVPGLVFVLLLNRKQLEAAFRGLYGADIDASSYLGKFIHFYLDLPKSIDHDQQHRDFNHRYAVELAKRYGWDLSKGPIESFVSCIADLAGAMNLSFRDLEKAFVLLAFADGPRVAPVLAWLIALKLKLPNLFSGLLVGHIEAHREALALARKLGTNESLTWFTKTVADLHAQVAEVSAPADETWNTVRAWGWRSSQSHVIPGLAALLDLEVK